MKLKSTPHSFLQPLERCLCDPVETFLTLAGLHPRQLRNFSSPKANERFPGFLELFAQHSVALPFVPNSSFMNSASGSHSTLETGCYLMFLDSGTQNVWNGDGSAGKGFVLQAWGLSLDL